MADGSDYISGITNERNRISRSRPGALVRVILEVSPLRRHYTYPFGMTIFFYSYNGISGAFEAWVDGCRWACVGSHEIDDLGTWESAGKEMQPSSVVTGSLTLRVDGQCTVSSLPQSFSTCFLSNTCKIFRDTMYYLMLLGNSPSGSEDYSTKPTYRIW
jgi:hypothetical protein